MKKIILLASMLTIGFFGFSQKAAKDSTSSKKVPEKAAVKDSVTADTKIISMNEFSYYLERINLVVKSQFSLNEVNRYEIIFRELNTIMAEADKKSKAKK